MRPSRIFFCTPYCASKKTIGKTMEKFQDLSIDPELDTTIQRVYNTFESIRARNFSQEEINDALKWLRNDVNKRFLDEVGMEPDAKNWLILYLFYAETNERYDERAFKEFVKQGKLLAAINKAVKEGLPKTDKTVSQFPGKKTNETLEYNPQFRRGESRTRSPLHRGSSMSAFRGAGRTPRRGTPSRSTQSRSRRGAYTRPRRSRTKTRSSPSRRGTERSARRRSHTRR